MTASIFNAEDLMSNIGEDIDVLDAIVAAFLDVTPGEMQGLKEALDARDMAAARRVAHKLKGSAASMRAEVLRDVFAAIDAAAANDDPARAVGLLGAASDGLAEFRDFFERMRGHMEKG